MRNVRASVTKFALVASVVSLFAISCGSPIQTSGLSTTEVPHTTVKDQKIENCWAYAMAAWAESLHLQTTGERVNISESYWTYAAMYENLVGSDASLKEVDTGTLWPEAKRLVEKFGLMYERDFSTAAQGELQENAEEDVNAELKRGGILANPADRTPANVMKVLDKAFHVRMADKKSKVISTKNFVIGKKNDPKQPRNIHEALTDPKRMWKNYLYPYVEGRAQPTNKIVQARQELLRRVMRALNKGSPVMMGVMVDFKAWNRRKNTFEASKLTGAAGKDQGGHLVVLSDYAVTNAPDGHGGKIDIGEGAVDPKLRALAVNGTVVSFIAKNSWGPSKARKIQSGYTRFEMPYLDTSWKWRSDYEKGVIDMYTALGDFTLPPVDD